MDMNNKDDLTNFFDTDNLNLSEKEIVEQKTTQKQIKGKIKRSDSGKWREINPDLLACLYSGKYDFTLSEIKIILYFIWNITSHKTREFIYVKKKTIQERTGLSQPNVSKTMNKLVKRQVIIKSKNDDMKYTFNSTTSTWK